MVFFNEVHALVPARTGRAEVAERVLSQLLTELNRVEELRGVTVVAATIRPDVLDPALLRAGRLEIRLEFPLPGEATRREIFAFHTRGKPLAPDVDPRELAARSEGLRAADIDAPAGGSAACDPRTVRLAGLPPKAGALLVAARHFQTALAQVSLTGDA
jgi:transitional endoplasmic reticulum ATPase